MLRHSFLYLMSIFRELEIKYVVVQIRKNGAWEKYATGSGCGNTSSPNDTKAQAPTGLREYEDNVSSTNSAVLPTAGAMTVSLEDVDMPIEMESVARDNPAELLPESSMLPLPSAVNLAIVKLPINFLLMMKVKRRYRWKIIKFLQVMAVRPTTFR